MKLGLEVVLDSKALQESLKGRRVGYLGHPASLNQKLQHGLYLLHQHSSLQLSCGFGPQHGMMGDKQDNMIESEDYRDPITELPIFSLYGEHRKPTPEMLEAFDVLLVDLQEVGARIYTYITTLFYFLEACYQTNKEVWVLDRPNPIGRPVEGSFLRSGFESFVGAARLPMRHGLTLGEAALWYQKEKSLSSLALKVVEMEGYSLEKAPGYGWPLGEYSWVNPSPNVPRLSTARVFPGTVFLEGTTLSEGRGTTRPLEMFGAPQLNHHRILKMMYQDFADWMSGCKIRTCYFEPTFHKFKGELCEGIQIHVDDQDYQHLKFRPYRLMSAYLKTVQSLYPGEKLWRDPPYEYEKDRMPIDLISGSSLLREWVEDSQATAGDWDQTLTQDEKLWQQERQEFQIYK